MRLKKQFRWTVVVVVCMLLTAAAATAYAASEAQAPAVPEIARAASEKTGVYIWNNAGQNGQFGVVATAPDGTSAEDLEITVWPVGHWSDARTYSASKNGPAFSVDVNIQNHGGRVGTYCAAVYIRTANGERKTLGSAKTVIPPQPGTLVVKAADSGQNAFALEVENAKVPDNAEVVFVITRSGKSCGEQTARQIDGVFQASVSTASLREPGTYDVRAICIVPGTEKPVPLGSAAFKVDGVNGRSVTADLSKDVQGAFTIRAEAEPASAVKAVYAEVQLEGTDRTHRYAMHGTDDVWTAPGNLEDFSHASGRYSVRVYAELDNGVHDLIGFSRAELRPQDYMWIEKDRRGADIHLDNTDPSRTELLLPVWSTADGQDDIIVYKAERTGETSWQGRMEFQNHADVGEYACGFVSGPTSLGNLLFDVLETDIHQKEPMRGVWVPSAYNLDFPRTRGDAEAQMDEFRQIVQNSRNWGFNALFVQIRPYADALYSSEINPWSDVLTGRSGRDPGYDPLAFMVQTAHDAGLELHAWLNPYRVRIRSEHSELHPKSVAVQHPDWVMEFNGDLYLDPANPGVREHLVDTVHEIIENYDIDGIHFDDYFYPYNYPLPDGEHRDGAAAAQMRENVNMMVRMVSEEVHSSPRHISFGISPFGIWKNAGSDPAGSNTTGVESYYTNYCDTVQWIKEGLLDYVCPQLYWQRGHKDADYAALVDWWAAVTEGTKTDLYIGQGVYNKTVAAEMQDQLALNAQYEQIAGSIFYRYGEIEQDPDLARRITEWYQNNPDR